jgi:glycosyltransferase involved in cell wall biosynthesis
LKIVHIITRLILGGAQENTLITCLHLAQRGHDVTLITGPAIGPEGDLYEKIRKAPFKTIMLDELIRPIRPINDAIGYFKLKKVLKNLKPDIIHTHSAKAGILGRYAGDALLGKFGNKQLPAIVHTIHGHSFGPYQSQLLNKFYISIEKAAAKKTDAFICVADQMTTDALEAGIGRPEQFTTAYSAIEMDDYIRPYSQQEISDFRRKYGINEQATVLVTIARLSPLKGHEYIIESAKKLAPKFENCIWLFVGDGALTDQIKDMIKLNSLRYKFIFTGLLKPSQIPLALHASDILVHTSMREGLARVLPQAMLAGVPAVSFDVGGAAEVVNENTGRLVKAGDIDALTNACEELMTNEQLRLQLGQAGKESVIKKFAPETMVDTIESVYKKLLTKT